MSSKRRLVLEDAARPSPPRGASPTCCWCCSRGPPTRAPRTSRRRRPPASGSSSLRSPSLVASHCPRRDQRTLPESEPPRQAVDPAASLRLWMTVTEKRLAVVDLGSNSFRLVVFTWAPASGSSAPTRSTSRPHRRGPRRAGRARARSRWSARSRPSTCTRTSAAPPGSTTSARSPPRRSATPSNRDEFLERAALDVQVLSHRGGGLLRLPGGGQLDDADRRRRARPRRRLDAADARRGPPGGRHALVAARRRAHDRALPGHGETVKPKHLKALREHVGGALERRRRGCTPTAATRRHRRHGPQPRHRRRAAEELPVVRRPGLPAAQEVLDELVDEFAELHARRAREGARHQARARRPDPGRRAGRPVGDGGRRVRLHGGHRGRPARGRVLRVAARALRPAAVRGRRAALGAQPRRRSTTPTSRTPSTSPRSR